MKGAAVHSQTQTGGHEAHPQLGFVRTYVFSTDHKVIGIQYMITSMLFLLSGFFMMLMMRWQLAWPGQPIPIIGQFLPETMAPGGVMLPEFYNQLGAMHGTIMVFLGIVPLGVAAFGNFVLPLQIGAKDMAFPFLNMLSYWIFLVGGILMLSSFAMPGGAAQSGWTSYAPLADLAPPGQTMWLIAMTFIITSSLFGAINFIVTTLNLRARGMTWLRLPFFVWCQFVTAILLVLAFPVLQGGAILQLLDRVAKANFFIPANLIFGGAPVEQPGGGNPLLWQHLFWFLAHPEVYVLLLPEFGIVAEILANGTRKPLFGYFELVVSVCAIGALSFIVWAHHMFLSGMRTDVTKFFTVTTMIISIPSVMVLTCFLLSLRGGSIHFTTPMLFALAFIPMFGIGGLTGLPLGFTPTDIYLHDTLYVIGHFHYVVVTGSLIALFGGLYYWFPKMFGRTMNEFWGKVHFWLTVTAMNGIFFPMMWQGMAGVLRRQYDPTAQIHNHPTLPLNKVMTISAICLALAQIPFVLNFFISIFKGKKTSANPWNATTLDWAACPSPPPHGNFAGELAIHRGPYEYSVPGHKTDWSPQHVPEKELS
ncbi:cbb3-type cytochrome c oxidase subunit I [bacterium]|nr:cbb3-type cytochrome c oxidase subunit I [bacterium]